MAVILVTYDLKKVGQNYQGVHEYLNQFTHCKGLESVWLLDTQRSPAEIRDGLKRYVDTNDVVFVTRLVQSWGSLSFKCAEWLNHSSRTW